VKTKRSSFLLLDANVIIWLFEQGIWNAVVELCDLHVGRTVIREAAYYERPDGARITIDLGPDISSGRISVFDVDYGDISTFLAQFDVSYLQRLDPGETEALVKLQSMPTCPSARQQAI
jgi:hypothetical protein